MKLLFDLYSSQGRGNVKFHGGGTYGQNLLAELLLQKNDNLDITVIMGGGSLNSNIKKLLDDVKPEIIEITSEQEVVTEILTEKYSVFYTAMPYYLEKYSSKLKTSSTRILGTIHGLREIELSYDRSYRSYLRNPLAKVRQFVKYCFPKKRLHDEISFYKNIIDMVDGNILTVSNHTKHQILNIFPQIDPNSVLVLNPIDRSVPIKQDSSLESFNVKQGEYFLLTSCDRPVKNSFRVLEAFEHFSIRGADRYKICCIGFRSHQKQIIRKKYKGIIDRVVFLDYLERSDLELLIQNAYTFIYPSISEGFGYPPLESMRNSVPVLASSHTAITEVCGDAVLYFNPFSPREIANRVSQIINDNNLHRELIERGHKRYDLYNQNIKEQIDSIISYILKQDFK